MLINGNVTEEIQETKRMIFLSIKNLNKFLYNPSDVLVETVYSELERLWRFSDLQELKVMMCSDELNLLPTLKRLLSISPDPIIIQWVTKILWYLSREHHCCSKISDASLGLIQLLLNFLQRSNEIILSLPYYFNSMCLFSNLLTIAETHATFLTEELQFFDFIRDQFIHRPNIIIFKLVSNFIHSATQSDLVPFLRVGLHLILLQTLFTFGPDPAVWPSRFVGIPFHCLNSVCSLAFRPNGAKEIYMLQRPEFFLQVMSTPQRIESLKAAMILLHSYCSYFPYQGEYSPSPLISEVEINAKVLIVFKQSFSAVLQTLWEVLASSLHNHPQEELTRKLQSEGFVYGILQISQLMAALKLMCLFSHQLQPLTPYPFTKFGNLCGSILQSFVEEREEFQFYLAVGRESIGGGKEDYESIRHLLEFFLLNCYYYNEQINSHDLSLDKFLGTADYQLSLLLRQLLSKRRCNLPTDVILLAEVLVQELDEIDKNKKT